MVDRSHSDRQACAIGRAVITLFEQQRGTLLLSNRHPMALAWWEGDRGNQSTLELDAITALIDLVPRVVPIYRESRLCRLCLAWWPATDFSTSDAKSGQLETRCRRCMAARARELRAVSAGRQK